ncbi:MAG TPA: class I SAM-dependent rRNA methyltransferase [Terracidiphilus sp.]|nr:class I SAM-dependent rRNA methyltransferase [Terracidiphilus sp.]
MSTAKKSSARDKPQKAPRSAAPSASASKESDRTRRRAALPPAPSNPASREIATAPGAVVSRRAADRLRSGHVWVYASDIESLTTSSRSSATNQPALLPVADYRGLLLGTALYSPASQIALRMVSSDAIDFSQWLAQLEHRLRAAIARRKPFLSDDTNACRLCFSEADEIPGLIADKYGDLFILQLLIRGLDSPSVREACVGVLRDEFAPASILERPDPRIRELEGLSAPGLAPLWSATPGSPLTSTVFHLNGLEFQYDANAGQKTGAFLDQRANYAAAEEWARRLGANGRALDVCTYQGGFALHLARVCRQVTGLDASRASLEVAERNLAANRARLVAEVDWIEADAFALLREWSEARESFDTIVLDPPAFAKTRRAVEGALRGYKELNLRALKMLRPGGLLITCSCSHHVGWSDLESAVAAAAADAHRRVRLLERHGAAPDHPVVLNIPETEYLKCMVLQAD